jgi:hypothetical protein
MSEEYKNMDYYELYEYIEKLRKQLDIAISTLLYYRASGTNDWAEKALAKIEKIGNGK